MDRRFLFAFVLVAAVWSSASAQIVKNRDSYSLRAQYVKGQVIRFMTNSSIDSSTGSLGGMSLKMPVTLSVLGFKNGVAYVKLTLGNAFLGNTKVHREESTTFPLDNRNRGATGSTNIGAPLPNKPVKIGATWKAAMPVTMGSSTMAMEGVYRFAGTQWLNGHYVGVITYSLSGPATGTGTMYLLVRDGTLFSNETRLTMSTSGVTRIHSTMTRIGQ